MNNVFDIENFNIIKDNENYYFFRALNMADNQDLESGIITDKSGQVIHIRTDRQRYEGKPKYSETDEISLEQVYDHIKPNYRKDTNCISLSSNANISIYYGHECYKDRYIMVKIPKKQFGKKIINAGQYMLEEIEKKINEYISSKNIESHILELLDKVEKSKTSKEIQQVMQIKYFGKQKHNLYKSKLSKEAKYKRPISRITEYTTLTPKQLLEKNKIIAKLTILEKRSGMGQIIPNMNNLLITTIDRAFLSLELIHYGEINQDEIIDIPKETVEKLAISQKNIKNCCNIKKLSIL